MPRLLAAALLLATACSSSGPPKPTKPAPPRTAVEPRPEPTEVVELPWEGELVERDPELCQIERTPVLDPSGDVFARIEIRRGGLELIERAVYRPNGPAEEITLHAGGCTHDSVSINLVVSDETPVDNYAHYRDAAVALLEGLPTIGDDPGHADRIAAAIKNGKRNPDTTIDYTGDPTITFDIVDAGDGRVELKTHYDFPL